MDANWNHNTVLCQYGFAYQVLPYVNDELKSQLLSLDGNLQHNEYPIRSKKLFKYIALCNDNKIGVIDIYSIIKVA